MAKKTSTTKPNTEQTSAKIATVAGQMLNGVHLRSSELWLTRLADDPATSEESRSHAVVLLGALAAVRRIAGSALNQRG